MLFHFSPGSLFAVRQEHCAWLDCPFRILLWNLFLPPHNMFRAELILDTSGRNIEVLFAGWSSAARVGQQQVHIFR